MGSKTIKTNLSLDEKVFIGLRYLQDKSMESPTYQSVHLERLLLQLKRKRFHLDLIKASTKKEKKSLILIARITVESCLADFVNLHTEKDLTS